jgi:hypothetical protein
VVLENSAELAAKERRQQQMQFEPALGHQSRIGGDMSAMPTPMPGPDDEGAMDIVAAFLLERARLPTLDTADQEQLEALLFAYLQAESGTQFQARTCHTSPDHIA